jgi:zinc transporter 5/7
MSITPNGNNGNNNNNNYSFSSSSSSITGKDKRRSVMNIVRGKINALLNMLYINPNPLTNSNSSSESYLSSAFKMMKRVLSLVLGNQDSRKIFTFLCLNLFFMFVEIVVGLYTNSLGLISDAGHMFFDCSSLCLGLFASAVVRLKKPDGYYTYGYGRFEVLAGFMNGIFLIFVAIFVFIESVERITVPHDMRTEGLLVTSILGFLVNIVGLIFFHDHSHHGHSHSSSSQETGCTDHHHHHGHSHGGGGGSTNQNMRGVYLHIMADALGSGLE